MVGEPITRRVVGRPVDVMLVDCGETLIILAAVSKVGTLLLD